MEQLRPQVVEAHNLKTFDFSNSVAENRDPERTDGVDYPCRNFGMCPVQPVVVVAKDRKGAHSTGWKMAIDILQLLEHVLVITDEVASKNDDVRPQRRHAPECRS